MKCHTPNCHIDIGERSIIGLCRQCYSSIYYWHKKTPKERVKRAQDIQRYRGRMNLLLPAAVSIPIEKTTPLDILPGDLKKGKRRRLKKAS